MKVAFEVSEHAFDPLSSLSRADRGFGADERADLIARIFADKSCHGPLPRRGALRLLLDGPLMSKAVNFNRA